MGYVLQGCDLVLNVHCAESLMDLLQNACKPHEEKKVRNQVTSSFFSSLAYIDWLMQPVESQKVPLSSVRRASAVDSGDDDLVRPDQHPVPVQPELLRHRLVAWGTATGRTEPV